MNMAAKLSEYLNTSDRILGCGFGDRNGELKAYRRTI